MPSIKPKKPSRKSVTISDKEQNDERDILARLGLTPHESAAYLALVDGGPASLSELSSRTGLHRALLYRALPALAAAGLAAVVPYGRRRRYVAESPERLRQAFADLAARFDTLLPELEQRRCVRGSRPEVRFVFGRAAIVGVLEDVMRHLKRGDVYYRYSSRQESTDVERYVSAAYRRLRDEKDLQRFVITSPTRAYIRKPVLNRSVKVVPATAGAFDFGINVAIFGDRVLYLDYNSETALIINNPMIAAFHVKVFKLLYERL